MTFAEMESTIALNVSNTPVNILNKPGEALKRKSKIKTHIDLDKNDQIVKTKKRRISERPQEAVKKVGAPFVSSLFGSNPVIPSLPKQKAVANLSCPVFSSTLFKDMPYLHPHLVKNLEDLLGAKQATTAQRLAIPPLLAGRDSLIRSPTGSGKTLAYAVPIVQALQGARPKLARSDGCVALIVLPTRELALQTYECFVKLVKAFTWLVPGLLVGGEKRKSEKARLRKGITVLVGTPGRLIDHAHNTKSLCLDAVRWLVLDEADKLLEMGYEKDVASLVEMLHGSHQTVLLSATLTPAVERLAGLTLNSPQHLDASTTNTSNEAQNNTLTVPHSLRQYYTLTPAKLRLVTLAAFVLRKCHVEGSSKMLVFLATQDMVDFHGELFTAVLTQFVEFFRLHGSMTQIERTQVFKAYRTAKSGVLLCTDVAARGLDLPLVDWIVQYTAPSSPADYVHRVGRTARVGHRGSALLMLTPAEAPFLDMLNNTSINLDEEGMERTLQSLLCVDFEDDQRCGNTGVEGAATALQLRFETAVMDQKKLYNLACNGYKSWARFYASYPKMSREAFNMCNIHLGHYAKSFALRDAPSTIGGFGYARRDALRRTQSSRLGRRQHSEDQVASRNKVLMTSEFDSGLAPRKTKKCTQK